MSNAAERRIARISPPAFFLATLHELA